MSRQYNIIFLLLAVLFSFYSFSCTGLSSVLKTAEQISSKFEPTESPKPALPDPNNVDIEQVKKDIETIINRTPWLGGRYPNEIEGYAGNALIDLTLLIRKLPTEDIIPYLNYPMDYVRLTAVFALMERYHTEKDKIDALYAKASPRVKMELYDCIKGSGRSSIDKKNQIGKNLDIIITDFSQDVFGTDLMYLNMICLNNYKECKIHGLTLCLRLLNSEYIVDRLDAMQVLTEYNDNGDQAVPALIELLQKPDEIPPKFKSGSIMKSPHAEACYAIGFFGQSAEAAIPALNEAMNDPSLPVRYYAAASLYRIGHKPLDQYQFLIEQFKNETSMDNLIFLCESLELTAFHTPEILPKLAECMRDKNLQLRYNAGRAVVKMFRPEEILDICRENMKSDNDDIRIETIDIMSRKIDNPGIKEELVSSLNDRNPNVKFEICHALHDSNQPAELYTPALVEAVNAEPQIKDIQTATSFLKEIGPPARDAIPGLLRAMKTNNTNEMQLFIDTISQIGGSSDIILKRLVEIINDKDLETASLAVERLGFFGDKAVNALPALCKLSRKISAGSSENPGRIDNLRYKVNGAIDRIVESINPTLQFSNEFLLEVMDCANSKALSFAIRELTRSGVDKGVILEKMKSLLNAEDFNTRDVAMKQCGELGDYAVSLIPDILACKTGETLSPFYNKTFALRNIIVSIEPENKEAVKYILTLIDNKDEYLSDLAIKKIVSITGNYDLVIKSLIHGIEKDPKQSYPYKALGDLRDKAVPALPFLLKIMMKEKEPSDRPSNPNVDISGSAYGTFCTILSSINQNSKIDKGILLDFLSASQPKSLPYSYFEIKRQIMEKYLLVGGEYDPLALKLAQIVSGKDPVARDDALKLLLQLGNSAQAALPILRDILQKGGFSDNQLLLDTIRKLEEPVKQHIETPGW